MTKGSIITELNGTSINNMTTLKNELQYYAEGDTVTVKVQIPENNGEYTEQSLDVTLGSK